MRISVCILMCALCGIAQAGHPQPIPGVVIFVNPIDSAQPPAATPWHHTRRAPESGNGRLWISAPFNREPTPIIEHAGRGPEHFGAEPTYQPLIVTRVGAELLLISPWEQSGESGLRHFDRARAEWLRKQGYTGGVRTFRNPNTNRLGSVSPAGTSAQPVPAGWFRAPADMPRTRPVEHVRYSLPPGMSPAAAARLQTDETRTVLRD